MTAKEREALTALRETLLSAMTTLRQIGMPLLEDSHPAGSELWEAHELVDSAQDRIDTALSYGD